ncbi:MAG: hypothetical protein WC656_07270 [Sulfurimonas sp.]|jgi:hypothetical protein
MKIEQSNVSLSASHQKMSQVFESEKLEKWDTEAEAPERLRQRADRLELSDTFKSLNQSKEASKLTDEMGDEMSLDPKLMRILRALEVLTGKKIDMSMFKKLQGGSSEEPQRVGWGIDYSYEHHEVHEESLEFSAQGNVKTADGRSMDFAVAVSMKNRSEVHESVSFKAGDALIDPLVLNFGADTVTISDVKHKFDLDLDGKSDTFSFVGSGSGFLALDKNSDKKINNGSELFGPTKGNGFKELAAYDVDKNNWIDENDKIFNSLVIWTKDDEGVENLYTLKEKNVGAIYLGNVNTEFTLGDSTQNAQGLLKESGIFLKESGGVGTMQEVDLKI